MTEPNSASTALTQSEAGGIARALRRWGGIALWTQVFVAVIPVIVITVVFSTIYGVQAPVRSAGFLGLLSLLGFVVLLITTFWCWRYRKLGIALTDGSTTATPKRLLNNVWTGVGLSCAGIVLSMTVLLAEMTYLFIRFLEAPQGGVPVIQTVTGGTSWISAVDILGLMTVVLTLAAEIVVLVAGLWLLSRVMLLPKGAAKA
jgi:hypothetical protein